MVQLKLNVDELVSSMLEIMKITRRELLFLDFDYYAGEQRAKHARQPGKALRK